MKKKSYIDSFLKFYLVAGVIVFATMTLTLGEISEDVINKKRLTVADVELSSWLHTNGSPFMTRAMWGATSCGATVPVAIISIAFGLYLVRRKRFYWLAALILSVIGGVVLNRLLKYAFHRPRPSFDDPILTLTSYSFPSGHTMAATVLYGVMGAYFFAKIPRRRWRLVLVLAAALLIVLVGFSRIYLGAHYLSDVLGAMAEGLAWLSLCLTVVYSIYQRYGHQEKAG